MITEITWNFKKSNIQESVAIFREQNIYIRSVKKNNYISDLNCQW